jgi:hypothetical protein
MKRGVWKPHHSVSRYVATSFGQGLIADMTQREDGVPNSLGVAALVRLQQVEPHQGIDRRFRKMHL